MGWSDVKPGDLIEFRFPGCQKQFGVFIRIQEVDIGPTSRLGITILTDGNMVTIPVIVDLDDVPVYIRSDVDDCES